MHDTWHGGIAWSHPEALLRMFIRMFVRISSEAIPLEKAHKKRGTRAHFGEDFWCGFLVDFEEQSDDLNQFNSYICGKDFK